MTNATPNIAALAQPEFPAIEAEIRRVLERVPPIVEIGGLPLADGALEQEIARSVEEILSTPLDDVLVAGWKKWDEIRRHADPSKTATEKPHIVPLVEHDLTSNHKPTIKILINGSEVAEIAFDLALKFHLTGFRLTIGNGAIQSVKTGEVRLNITLSYKEVQIWTRRFDEVELPGRLDFDPPIEI